MNEENNNLNSVVLGNVSNEQINTVPSSNVVQPGSNANEILEPNVNTVTEPITPNASQVIEPPVNSVNPEVNQNVVNNNVTNTPSAEQNPTGENSSQVEVPQTPTPQPAYTSINSINPGSMPGFENSVGTNPPISLESEKAPKKKGNKVAFIFIVILLLILVSVGTYYILNYTDLLTKKESITITANNVTYNINEELSKNIDDYASIKGTSSSNCTLNIKDVDNTKEGTYKYSITCSNITKEANIEIVDNTELLLQTQTAYHVKGEEATAKEFVKNLQEDVTYSFVDEEAVKQILNGEVGSYSIKIKAVDAKEKEAVSEAKLVITKYKIKGYIICNAKEQALTDYIMEENLKFAIFDDGNNGFANIAFDIYKFKYKAKDTYQKVKTDETGKVTINEVNGIPEFDEENLTITITNEFDSTKLYDKYGTDNLKNYSSIRTYFTQKESFSCSYEKVNA